MKIAVITQEDHSAIGGIEKVNRLIYQLFQGEHEIVEFPTLADPRYRSKKVHDLNPNIKIDNRLLGWKPYVFIWGGSYSRKNFNYLKDNFDLIIIGASNPPKRWIKDKKFYLYQHMDWNFYGIGGKPLHWSIGQAITSIFFGAGSFRVMFKWATNSIFFAPETSIPTKGNSFYAPLSAYSIKEIKNHAQTREGFVWFARLIDEEKGIKALIKLANMNSEIDIYGAGKDLKMLKKGLNDFSMFKGYLKNDDVPDMLRKKKVMIMTSNYEGFPLTIVESLSQGTPVVMFDAFSSARFFSKSNAVFLFKKGDIEGMNQKLKEINNLSEQDYAKLSAKAIKFAQENLSIESYKNNIQKVIDNARKNNE